MATLVEKHHLLENLFFFKLLRSLTSIYIYYILKCFENSSTTWTTNYMRSSDGFLQIHK